MQLSDYFILLQEYLRDYGILAKRRELQLLLQSSPSFPSVLSIIQTCNYFGINAKAYKADYNALLMNKRSTIVHIKENSSDKFVLIKEVSDKMLIYKDMSISGTLTLTPGEFSKIWTGILIVSENDNEERIIQSEIQLKQYWYISLFLIGILIFFLYSMQTINVFTVGVFFLKCVGVWLAYNLIRHEKGVPLSSMDNFCRKKDFFDCDKVLASKASRIFKVASLADCGFIYFTTGLFTLVLSNFLIKQNSILLILFYLSIFSTPIILLLVLYQKFVVKKWCPLCLSVAGIIFIEFSISLFYPAKFHAFDYIQPIILLLFSFIVSILILYVLKNYLQLQKELLINKTECLRLKRNPLIVATAFGQQKRTIIPRNNQIVIGYEHSFITITTLLSPFCLYCTKKVENIVILLERYPQKLLWQIRFDGIEANEYHPMNQIQLHLMQLCNNKTDDVKLQIISDWYRKQSVQWLIDKYPIKEITTSTISDFAEHTIVNRQFKIKKVPTVWVNNRELPEEYSVEDIPFLLTDINLLRKVSE